MGVLKSKVPSRRPKKAASSPVPEGPMGGMTSGPTCGHGDCGRECAVRYVGPTSHMRDHSIVHIARGVTHVWTAAIVSGLAIVLTGAIAWSSVEAQTSDTNNASVITEVRNIGKRVERLEALLKSMNDKCEAQAKDCRGAKAPTDPSAIFPTPGANAVACTVCATRYTECQKLAGTNASSTKLASCKTAYESCSKTCKK